MNAALIAIGTELTRGIIQDKHAVLISKELTKLGISVKQIVLLPDDGSIKEILNKLSSYNLIIITGGLGPTSDDMTRQIIASVAGKKLEKNEIAWSYLVERVGIERAKGANEKQALIPEGFKVIKNENGTAPAFYGYLNPNCLCFALPGPPKEMEPIFYSNVLPALREHLNIEKEEREEYSTFLVPEAKLEELYNEINPNLTWATRFQTYKISLYVSGGKKEERDLAIERLREKVGKYRIIKGDSSPLSLVSDLLKEKGLTVSSAESCTGGLGAELLTSQPGSSSYFVGSVVSYATRIKSEVLGVNPSIIEKESVVSTAVASSMAKGVRNLLSSDYSFSVTGVAGPDKQGGKEAGDVCIAIANKDEEKSVELHFSPYSRDSIRKKAISASFLLLYAYIQGEDIINIASSWNYI